MEARDIFMKTLPFCWAKLGLGILNILVCALLFAILMGISLLFKSEGVAGIMFFVWLGLIGIVNFVLRHYVGYLVKAGHVAVIAESFRQGRVPSGSISVGASLVRERFGTANVYFALDKLVAGAVKQLQRTLGRLTDWLLGSLPMTDKLKSALNFFLDISLGYIDECCLGYTFYRKEQNAYKSACDGVIIYAKNWKELLKNAAWTALSVILSLIVVTLISFVLFGGLFRLLDWSGFVAFVLALMMAWAIKYAFIDSWMMVKMMHGYMKLAPSTPITFDLYGQMSNVSSRFREMFRLSGETSEPAQEATPQALPDAAPVEPLPVAGVPAPAEPVEVEARPRFCAQCGVPLQAGMPFCGNCGTKAVD